MQKNIWKFVTIGLILITVIIILPFIASISKLNISELFNDQNSFFLALLRSFEFAIFSAIILIIFGFSIAFLIREVPFFSFTGKSLGILIIPIILGNLTIGFISKIIFGDTQLFSEITNSTFYYKLIFFIILQIWQYGLLFIYMFWLNFQSISENRLNYSIANKFTIFQRIKDIYIPHSKNLMLLLFFVAFTFSLFEESKIQYLFKVSRGTDSELLTTWLTRNYQSLLLINSEFAENYVFNFSFLILIVSILTSALLYVFFNKTLNGVLRSNLNIGFKNHISKISFKGLKYYGVYILLLIVLIPIITFLLKIELNSSNLMLNLGFPLLMSVLATISSVVVSIFLGISLRLGWPEKLNSFNNKSLIFFLALFLLLLIPPIVIMISGFKWMAFIGYNSEYLVFAIWIVGHTILSLPILGSFVLFNHFRVSNNELNYLKVFRLKKSEIVKYSFLSRFKAEYLLLFIIGLSFIWNDSTLNNLFSDYIPSFASGLKMLITGRGADFSKAFGFIIVSFILAISSVVIWRLVIEKASRVNK